MQRFLYQVQVDAQPDGWRVTVVGSDRVWVDGPYATVDGAEAAVCALVRRWRARAQAVGGHVWRPRGHQIGVALPEGHAARRALPFAHDPCSAVGGSVADARVAAAGDPPASPGGDAGSLVPGPEAGPSTGPSDDDPLDRAILGH
ncbi:MAG: hypothetical protein H6733_11105 [Alphaproteobacteria bacterium]|nr:hypothetical protein [Alphaproteobacteria bacterium]